MGRPVEAKDVGEVERDEKRKKLACAYKRLKRALQKERAAQVKKLSSRGRDDAVHVHRVSPTREAFFLLERLASDHTCVEQLRQWEGSLAKESESENSKAPPSWAKRTLRKCKAVRVELKRAQESIQRVERRVGGLIRAQRQAQRSREIARKRRERREQLKRQKAELRKKPKQRKKKQRQREETKREKSHVSDPIDVNDASTRRDGEEESEAQHESWAARARERERIAAAIRGEEGAGSSQKKVKFQE
jgi:hypothetical protein